MTRIQTLAGLALALAITCAAGAQTPAPENADCGKLPTRVAIVDCTQSHMQVRTIQLKNIASQNEANEVLVAVRNIFDPSTKIYLIASDYTIVVASYPQEVDRIEAFVHKLDQPKPTYRLTFTITDFDGAAKTGSRHFSLIGASGQRVIMKQGSKVPVVTGKFDKDAGGSETQNTYLDIGINFDVTVNPYANGLIMKSHIEQSSIAPTASEIGPHDPIVHQTVIDGVSTLALGKPSVLGSLDVPDSQKHMEISVVAEALP